MTQYRNKSFPRVGDTFEVYTDTKGGRVEFQTSAYEDRFFIVDMNGRQLRAYDDIEFSRAFFLSLGMKREVVSR